MAFLWCHKMPIKNPHPLYHVWQSMKNRCQNPHNPQWKDYGGRGITVCEEWRGPNGFKRFLLDLGERPHGYQLDRVDVNGNYTPKNCRWASRKTQQRNRRDTSKVFVEGQWHIVADLVEASGLKNETIINRAATATTIAEIVSPQRKVFAAGLALGGRASGDAKAARKECKRGHPYDERNTYWTANGHRQCRKCRAERAAERRITSIVTP
jgi:hypothetical protein